MLVVVANIVALVTGCRLLLQQRRSMRRVLPTSLDADDLPAAATAPDSLAAVNVRILTLLWISSASGMLVGTLVLGSATSKAAQRALALGLGGLFVFAGVTRAVLLIRARRQKRAGTALQSVNNIPMDTAGHPGIIDGSGSAADPDHSPSKRAMLNLRRPNEVIPVHPDDGENDDDQHRITVADNNNDNTITTVDADGTYDAESDADIATACSEDTIPTPRPPATNFAPVSPQAATNVNNTGPSSPPPLVVAGASDEPTMEAPPDRPHRCTVRRSDFGILFAGVCSGVLSGMLGVGGPPLIILLSVLDLDKDESRSTMMCLWATLAPLQAVFLFVVARVWHDSLLALGAVCALGAVLGLAAGIQIANRVQKDVIIRTLTVLLIATGGLMIVSA
jgi:hypothetical protein